MKRKSILIMIVAFLFTGTAIAQVGAGAWYVKNGTTIAHVDLAANGNNSQNSPYGDVEGTSVIYFCSTADSLYPIELGYNVAGKNLDPAYGTWSLLAKTDKNIVASDFEYGIAKNGGAGNAFKVVASNIGGYLFQYEATDPQCGLNIGHKYWIVVFILPTTVLPVSKDTIVCPGGDLPVNVTTSFPYTALYRQAGFTITPSLWSSQTFTVKRDKAGIDTTYSATYTLVAPSSANVHTAYNGYHCGTALKFDFHVKVMDLDNYPNSVVPICAADTAGSNGQRNPNVIFQHAFGGSTGYTPNTIVGVPNTWGQYSVSAGPNRSGKYYKVFAYAYTSCSGAKTLYDTLVLTSSPSSPIAHFWGYDTAQLCRQGGNVTPSLVNTKNAITGAFSPQLDVNDSWWAERGPVTGGTYPNYTYTSPSAGALVGGYNFDPSKISSNVGYHFTWRIDNAANCFGGDTGRLVIILQDPFAGRDHVMQTCGTVSGNVDLEAYTGLKGATWTAAGSEPVISNPKQFNIASLNPGMYIYKIDFGAGCGTASTSKFYLKKGSTIKVASKQEVKFCVSKLPPQINLWDILGIYSAGSSSWAGTSSSHPGFDTTNGIITIAQFGAVAGTYNFKITKSNFPCLPYDVEVDIIFTASIL